MLRDTWSLWMLCISKYLNCFTKNFEKPNWLKKKDKTFSEEDECKCKVY